MFAYAGNSRAELNKLYSSLLRSAQFDEIRAKFAPTSAQHRDGWGYVIFNNERLHHYRTAKAIFEDNYTLPYLTGKIFALFHARLASDDSPNHGCIFSHPFSMASDLKVIFICQNGKIPNALLPKEFPQNKMSTEYTLELIAKYGTKDAIKKVIGMGKSTTNLLILEIDRQSMKPLIYCLNRYKKTDDSDKNEYYTMYQKKMRYGNAVFSSTLTKHDITGGSVLPYAKLIRLSKQ